MGNTKNELKELENLRTGLTMMATQVAHFKSQFQSFSGRLHDRAKHLDENKRDNQDVLAQATSIESVTSVLTTIEGLLEDSRKAI